MGTSVSIVLATYNGARFLREQLDSFVNQTRLPDELVVCDDASEDDTLVVAEAFAGQAPFPVRVISNTDNVGSTPNFSRALALCRGDIVFLSDQDDVWLPTKIEVVTRYFELHPETQLVIHDLAYCRHDLTPVGQTKIERMRGHFDLQERYVVGMASAIRGELLGLCLPIPVLAGMAHDNWLHLCARALGAKAVIEDVLALYRRHDGNATAGGRLNVDFVTGPRHFSAKERGLASRLARMAVDNDRTLTRAEALLDWLLARRDQLMAKGLASQALLDASIVLERRRVAASGLRRRIFAQHKSECFANVHRLYRLGGYDFYRGWKSAVGDLIFRCLLRR